MKVSYSLPILNKGLESSSPFKSSPLKPDDSLQMDTVFFGNSKLAKEEKKFEETLKKTDGFLDEFTLSTKVFEKILFEIDKKTDKKAELLKDYYKRTEPFYKSAYKDLAKAWDVELEGWLDDI